jgi:hypothetical protein
MLPACVLANPGVPVLPAFVFTQTRGATRDAVCHTEGVRPALIIDRRIG